MVVGSMPQMVLVMVALYEAVNTQSASTSPPVDDTLTTAPPRTGAAASS